MRFAANSFSSRAADLVELTTSITWYHICCCAMAMVCWFVGLLCGIQVFHKIAEDYSSGLSRQPGKSAGALRDTYCLTC